MASVGRKGGWKRQALGHLSHDFQHRRTALSIVTPVVAPTPPTVPSIARIEGRCGEKKLGTVWDSGGPELERAESEIDREGRYDGVTVTGVTIRDGGI